MNEKTKVFLRETQQFKTVNITDSEKPEISQTVLEKWQNIINLVAKIVNVPSGLIMKITQDSMEVFLKSNSKDNPYEIGGCDALGSGLYCETAIGTNRKLLVENALKEDKWKTNPDIKLDMVSYFGMPIQWPDDRFFGTICILDNKANAYTDDFIKLIGEFKLSIEKDLQLLCDKLEIENALEQIKVLRGLVPICSKCKKIRDDRGFWNHLELYIESHSEATFSHSICRDCSDELYGKEKWYKNMKQNKGEK